MTRHEDEAQFKLGGLSIWIERYQYAAATDYWDGNWIVVRAVCVGQQAVVKLCDPCIHLSEVDRWGGACRRVLDGQADSAPLDPMEPYLDVTIDRSGEFKGLVATVKMTPDNITQFHEFRFPIDRSDLARLVESIAIVLAEFPIRGTKPNEHKL